MITLDAAISDKYELLQSILAEMGKVAVAFSGGVDSTLLLKTARMTLGDNVLAVHASSVLQKEKSSRMVRSLADAIGVRLIVRNFFPLSWPEFVANSENRCYYCKNRIYSNFLESIPPGYSLLDASQLDDLSQERPGRKAIKELGIRTPLVEASLSKKEVRTLSKKLHLPNWCSPSESCLATRVSSGRPITEEELQRIARSEAFLEDLGFSGCRVKFDRGNAVIAVAEDDYARIVDYDLRLKVEKFFLTLASQQVFLTLLGRPKSTLQ